MIRVLLTTYSAAAHSSFGTQTRALWEHLLRTKKYEVVQHGWFHRETCGPPPWQIIPTNHAFNEAGDPVFTQSDRYGAQSLGRAVDQTRPDIIWALADPFMVYHLKDFRNRIKPKTVLWFPIDGDPVPPAYASPILENNLAVCVTHWGADLVGRLTGKRVGAIYHGVDLQKIQPMLEEDRRKLREEQEAASKLPKDALLLGFVGRNQFRKMPWNVYPLLYYLNSGEWAYCYDCTTVTLSRYIRTSQASEGPVKQCGRCHNTNLLCGTPIKTRMWMHSFEKAGGITFTEMERIWQQRGNLVYSKGLSFGHAYTVDQMNEFYNLIDIYVSLSGGEGFCLPIAEAAAAGRPVVFTDYSGQAEVGRMVGGIPIRPAAMIHEHETGINSERAIADIGQAVYEIWKLHTNGYPKPGRMHMNASKHFSWGSIAAQWDTLLTELHDSKDKKPFGVRL